MLKYLLLLSLTLPCYAHQTTQEIVDSCKRIYLHDYGNWMVLACVKKEIKAQAELEALTK